MNRCSLILVAVVALALISSELLSQKIENHYQFSIQRHSYKMLEFDNILLKIDSSTFNRKRWPSKVFLYCYKNSKLVDSVLLTEGFSSLVPVRYLTVGGASAQVYLGAIEKIINIDRATGRLEINRQFDRKRDSVLVSGIVDGLFICWRWANFSIQTYNPLNSKRTEIFDFNISADDRMKKYIGTDDPVGIGDIFSFSNGEKILIKTGYNEAGASFDCTYFIVNTRTSKIDKLPFSHFEPLILEPRQNLKKLSIVALDTFSIDIDRMYFDTSDSVGYITCRFLYDVEVDSSHIKSMRYKQDAFIIDRDYYIIGRALERNFNVEYPIYNDEKKAWDVLRSYSDSLKTCFFKFKLRHSLEKSFYDIFYSNLLSEARLRSFDKYELDLLKNFIFAKHNYQFESKFYQSYFNTFAFYFDESKRKSRLKNVNRLLTESDKINISLIKTILGRK